MTVLGLRAQSSLAGLRAVMTGLAGMAVIALTAKSSLAQPQCTATDPCASAPNNLGTIGSVVGGSGAAGTNYDGSVVVGFSEIVDSRTHAFRWTSGSGM